MSKIFTAEVFAKIEKIYGFVLPEEFKKVYGTFDKLPENWYDWSNFSPDNVQKIKSHIRLVKEDIATEIDYIDWNDIWSAVPQDTETTHKEILKKLASAPSLMPIFGHRYIAAVQTSISPVFSIVGSDIIYYSASLTDYLRGETINLDVPLSSLTAIPFWSEIAQ